MEPTHTKMPDVGNWTDVGIAMGRPPTDREKIEITCVWAGQLGHEKCGWCKECRRPRSFVVVTGGKKCSHPLSFIWRT